MDGGPDLDLTVANRFKNSISVLLNECRFDVLPGDVNRDGSVNLLDIAAFGGVLISGTYQAEADMNQDGFVNLLDVQPFVVLLSAG